MAHGDVSDDEVERDNALEVSRRDLPNAERDAAATSDPLSRTPQHERLGSDLDMRNADVVTTGPGTSPVSSTVAMPGAEDGDVPRWYLTIFTLPV